VLTPGGGIIEPTGVYTAGNVGGTYLVQATSIDTPGKFALATVVVAAVQVTVDPGCVALAPDDVQQFAATVTGTDDQTVTWTASGGSIDGTGSYVAGGSPGIFQVQATSVADPMATGTATVVIAEPAAGARAAESCVSSTTTTNTSTTTSTSIPGTGAVRLLENRQAVANVSSQASIWASDPAPDLCQMNQPPDPNAPPLVFEASCASQRTGPNGGSAAASVLASLAVSTTPAGVDGQGNPLISALRIVASVSCDVDAVTGTDDEVMLAKCGALTGGSFNLQGTPGTPLFVEAVIVGPPPLFNGQCTVSGVPATLPANGQLVFSAACTLGQAMETTTGAMSMTRSVDVTLTFGSP
jgi:hypothetical protein